ncbi:MAG TPA: hypothetical protein VD999_02745 [Vitreimonas sp.]|nr:hypothetical protein [Vitreimonas sp.]
MVLYISPPTLLAVGGPANGPCGPPVDTPTVANINGGDSNRQSYIQSDGRKITKVCFAYRNSDGSLEHDYSTHDYKDDCYQLSGVGTTAVTVTRHSTRYEVPTWQTGSEAGKCQDLVHLDVFLVPATTASPSPSPTPSPTPANNSSPAASSSPTSSSSPSSTPQLTTSPTPLAGGTNQLVRTTATTTSLNSESETGEILGEENIVLSPTSTPVGTSAASTAAVAHQVTEWPWWIWVMGLIGLGGLSYLAYRWAFLE